MGPVLHPDNPNLQHLPHKDRNLFCTFGKGPTTPPTFPTIADAIAASCLANPARKAALLVTPSGTISASPAAQLTYAQLKQQSDVLAALLHAKGVSNGDAVCLFLSRGLEMLVGIAAVLKVGACYVPQHVGVAPPAQLSAVAWQTAARVVLTTAKTRALLPAFEGDVAVICIDDVMRGTHGDGAGGKNELAFSGARRPVRPDDTCYIIFTSGTTGKPKGVQVTHGNVANILLTPPMDLGMRPGVRVAQLLSIAFDMGAWEMLGSLSHGATLVIRGRDIEAAAALSNVVVATPSVLGRMRCERVAERGGCGGSVRVVAVAGEVCPLPLARRWGKLCTFYNSCGPTEVTIVNTAQRFGGGGEGESLTIGRPTPNNTVYVLDRSTGLACGIGEVGEMWGGGLCVSKGYLNNEGLTRERYRDDPFVKGEGGDGGGWRMYRTGDLGRWNERGELEHFGRVDEQVKVKGFRVELDGVAEIIEAVSGVHKAVVLKVGDSLSAWVTPKHIDENEVRNAVGAALPYYCVPAGVTCVSVLPLTGNGKVDKRKLRREVEEGEMGNGGKIVEEGVDAGRRAVRPTVVSKRYGWRTVVSARVATLFMIQLVLQTLRALVLFLR